MYGAGRRAPACAPLHPHPATSPGRPLTPGLLSRHAALRRKRGRGRALSGPRRPRRAPARALQTPGRPLAMGLVAPRASGRRRCRRGATGAHRARLHPHPATSPGRPLTPWRLLSRHAALRRPLRTPATSPGRLLSRHAALRRKRGRGRTLSGPRRPAARTGPRALHPHPATSPGRPLTPWGSCRATRRYDANAVGAGRCPARGAPRRAPACAPYTRIPRHRRDDRYRHEALVAPRGATTQRR